MAAQQNNWLWLQIIIGIIGGGILLMIILFGFTMCTGVALIGAASHAADDRLNLERTAGRVVAAPEIQIANDATQHIDATILQLQRDNLAAAERARHANDPLPIPEGYRCIGKQLFKELPNGYEQVTDGSAPKYCR